MSASSGGRREPQLKALELLDALSAGEVQFVVIGGFSLAAHGYVRGTKDVDVVPQPSTANLRRLLGVLEDIEAEPLAVGDFRENEVLELTLESLELGGNWLLHTRLGRLDVMQYVEGMRSYARLRSRAVTRELAEVSEAVSFAGYDDLIAMKQAAGREEDLRDIAELERRRYARSIQKLDP